MAEQGGVQIATKGECLLVSEWAQQCGTTNTLNDFSKKVGIGEHHRLWCLLILKDKVVNPMRYMSHEQAEDYLDSLLTPMFKGVNPKHLVFVISDMHESIKARPTFRAGDGGQGTTDRDQDVNLTSVLRKLFPGCHVHSTSNYTPDMTGVFLTLANDYFGVDANVRLDKSAEDTPSPRRRHFVVVPSFCEPRLTAMNPIVDVPNVEKTSMLKAGIELVLVETNNVMYTLQPSNTPVVLPRYKEENTYAEIVLGNKTLPDDVLLLAFDADGKILPNVCTASKSKGQGRLRVVDKECAFILAVFPSGHRAEEWVSCEETTPWANAFGSEHTELAKNMESFIEKVGQVTNVLKETFPETESQVCTGNTAASRIRNVIAEQLSARVLEQTKQHLNAFTGTHPQGHSHQMLPPPPAVRRQHARGQLAYPPSTRTASMV